MTQPLALPPINTESPLLAQVPIQPPEPAPDVSDSGFLSFDTFELQHALMRSRQQTGACGGLRRATSAPHSMDSLGWEHPGAPSTPSATSSKPGGAGYLQPSGGPMRRNASSLGLRRASSFFWTPAAHHDFERAISELSARGTDVSAGNILGEMSHAHAADIKLTDIDRHLRKNLLVQRRVLQQLGNSSGDARMTHAPAPAASPHANNAASALAAAPVAAGMLQRSPVAPRMTFPTTASSDGPSTGLIVGSAPIRLSAAPALVRGGSSARSSAMSSVAEEPPTALPPPTLSQPATTAPLALAAGQSLSESLTLAAQFNAQRVQHVHMTAAREALVAGAEVQHAA